MVADTRSPVLSGRTSDVRAPPAVLKSVRPKLFRRASLTSWGKDNLGMTRAAADVNLKELMLTVQQQKYEDRDKAAQREMSRTASFEGEASIRSRDERRRKLLARSGDKRDFLVRWEREGRTKWNSNQAAFCRYERRLLNYELAVRATAIARRRISREKHTDDGAEGVRWFEKNLEKLGLDPGVDSMCSRAGAGGDATLPNRETRATFRSRLLRAVLDQNFTPGSNAELMAELRFRGNAGRRGRLERQHRLVKTEVGQRRAKVKMDAHQNADQYLRNMLEEGRARRVATAEHWERDQALDKQALADCERYAGMRADEQIAFEVAFNERAMAVRERYTKESADREDNANALHARLKASRDKKRRRLEMMCSQISNKVADLAVVASEERAHQGGIPLTPTTWARLKRWFCSLEPFFPEAPAPEHKTKPIDITLHAKGLIESRNLDRCEGHWRPYDLAHEEVPPKSSPLARASKIVMELAMASGAGPREAPTYGRDGGRWCAGEGEGEHRHLSVRLVVLGDRNGLDDLCAELGRWTRLYVCTLEFALECAMEVGGGAAASEGQSSKGKGGAVAKGANVANRKASTAGKKSSLAGGVEGIAIEDEEVSAEKAAREAKEEIVRKAFDPKSSEDCITAFEEAAAAYFAWRTHPKKAALPVPVAMITDILAKHLSCRAPGERGWILVGYPNSVLECKMFENSLSGYTDEDVTAELDGGKSSKPEAKKKKGSVVPTQEEPPLAPVRSALDAVLDLTTSCSNASRQAQESSGLQVEVGEGRPTEPSTNEHGDTSTAVEDAEVSHVLVEAAEPDVGNTDERNARAAWWARFEGGHLACDVPHETNGERMLESLFLMVNAAQNKKDDVGTWLEKRALDELSSTENEDKQVHTDSAKESKLDTKAPIAGVDDDVSLNERPSPLGLSLHTALDGLRLERRARMPHTTRIRVEALTGERELDIDSVRSAISKQTEARGGRCRVISALQELEAECTADVVVEWATAAEFSLATGLRTFDERWTTACLQLEGEIDAWMSTRRAGDGRKPHQSRRGRAWFSGEGGTHGVGSHAPLDTAELPEDGGHIWEALREFELCLGDVADDRHASAEVTVQLIDDELSGRVCSWSENLAIAAVCLCAAERESYQETVRSLQVLNDLIGLDRDGGGDPDLIRNVTLAGAEALSNELTAMSGGQESGNGFSSLKQEVRRATETVSRDIGTPSSDQGASDVPPRDVSLLDPDTRHHAVPTGKEQEDREGKWEVGGQTEDRTENKTNQQAQEGESAPGRNETTDADVVDQNTDASDITLSTATWLCRQRYVCRMRGVVARLARAFERCDFKVASTRAAVRRLKRRRVQLEHKGISDATLKVRRALEGCDRPAILDMLQNGIPLRVDDHETFAADLNVALPWGLNGLDLPCIAKLAAQLRQSLRGAEEKGESEAVMATTTEVVRAIRDWSCSMATEAGIVQRIPSVWTGASTDYIEKLLQEISTSKGTDNVSWRRLIHCLLLGHVASAPTVDELRSMLQTFRQKSSLPSRLSDGETLVQPNNAQEDITTKPSDAVARPTAISETIPGLRIEQRHMPGVRMWFEDDDERRELDERGRHGQVPSPSSSAIKAAYCETWIESDGRLNALDLLLTLCAVPQTSLPGSDPIGAGAENPTDGRGILFSLGFFRAFAMLAETSSLAAGVEVPAFAVGIAASTASSLSHEDSRQQSNANALMNECESADESSPSSTKDDGDVPRVTLPQLRAILEHGGDMSAADVSGVCNTFLETQQESPAHQGREQEPLGHGAKRELSPGDDSTGREKRLLGGEGHGQDGVGETGLSSDTPDATDQDHARSLKSREIGEREEANDSAKGVTGGEIEGSNATAEVAVDCARDGDESETAITLVQRERLIMVSFDAVCECETVRAWIRRGAYTLPSFEATSGGAA